MSKLQAQNDYVIIRAERESKSGITLLKNEQYNEKDAWIKESPLIVLSIGPDVKKIAVGDRVVLGATRIARYDYLTKILKDENVDNVTYFACKEEDIVAIIQ